MDLLDSKSGLRRKSSKASDHSSSSYSGDSSSPKFRRSAKLKFIKNVRPDSLKRPSMVNNSEGKGNVAYEQTDCTLVGFRKLDTSSLPVESASTYELGTLGAADLPGANTPGVPLNALYNAVSMPTLLGKGHLDMANSGSMPELCTSASLKGTVAPDLVTSAQNGADSGSEPDLAQSTESVIEVNPQEGATTPTNPSDFESTSNQSQSVNRSEAMLNPHSAGNDGSATPSDSGSGEPIINGVENGYFASSSSGEDINASPSDTKDQDCGKDSAEKGVDYNSLAKSLTTALGEAESVEGNTTENMADSTPSLSDNKPASDEHSDSNEEKLTDETEDKSDQSVVAETEIKEEVNSDKKSDSVTVGSSAADNSTASDGGGDRNTKKEIPASERPPLIPARPDDKEESTYMSGHCTILELLQEEWELAEQEKEDKDKDKARSNSIAGTATDISQAASATVNVRPGTKVGIAHHFPPPPWHGRAGEHHGHVSIHSRAVSDRR